MLPILSVDRTFDVSTNVIFDMEQSNILLLDIANNVWSVWSDEARSACDEEDIQKNFGWKDKPPGGGRGGGKWGGGAVLPLWMREKQRCPANTCLSVELIWDGAVVATDPERKKKKEKKTHAVT